MLHEVRGRNHDHPEMGPKDKKSLEPVLAEFRTGIAHHRAQGATEQRIRQILGEAIWLAFQQVKRSRNFELGSAMSSGELRACRLSRRICRACSEKALVTRLAAIA